NVHAIRDVLAAQERVCQRRGGKGARERHGRQRKEEERAETVVHLIPDALHRERIPGIEDEQCREQMLVQHARAELEIALNEHSEQEHVDPGDEAHAQQLPPDRVPVFVRRSVEQPIAGQGEQQQGNDRDVAPAARSIDEEYVQNRSEEVELQLDANRPKTAVQDAVAELAHEVRIVELQDRRLGEIQSQDIEERNVDRREIPCGGDQQQVDEHADV